MRISDWSSDVCSSDLAEGRLTELVGHLMRSNPLCAALQAGGRATILFKGPDAYVSPEHAGVRDWGPTWNYAQIKVEADVQVDEALTEWSLQLLTDAMESGRSDERRVGEESANTCRYRWWQ